MAPLPIYITVTLQLHVYFNKNTMNNDVSVNKISRTLNKYYLIIGDNTKKNHIKMKYETQKYIKSIVSGNRTQDLP